MTNKDSILPKEVVMSNIYPIGQTCQYYVRRAARNRRAGQFEQAITLLTRAKAEYPGDDDVELELAKTYDEMGSEEAAMRSYLRLVHRESKHRALALFELAITSAQQAQLGRAAAYFEAFAASDRNGVSTEMAALLQRQLSQALEKPHGRTRKARARGLEQRAIMLLHAGKIHAARRAVMHSIRLQETAQRRLLKAACHLIREEGESSVREAQRALELRPGYVQAMCLLVDAYILTGDTGSARRVLYQAARIARATDSLLNVAIESAKHGYDRLTLITTKRILKREPYHQRAMAMRACALMNLGSRRPAAKLFGRLCTLYPDESIYEAYYRIAKGEEPMHERLTMAQDVPTDEAMDRGIFLLSTLSEEPSVIRSSEEELRRICRCAQWALRSSLVGANITMIAVIILAALDMPKTREVLFDALVDPQIGDPVKQTILQAVSVHCKQKPAYADLQGRLVRLAAGASMSISGPVEPCQPVVQSAANALMRRYPGAAGALLELWIAYIRRYGSVAGRRAAACAAALEYVYHLKNGRKVSALPIAQRYNISRRLLRLCARRILDAHSRQAEENTDDESTQQWRKSDEVHQF